MRLHNRLHRREQARMGQDSGLSAEIDAATRNAMAEAYAASLEGGVFIEPGPQPTMAQAAADWIKIRDATPNGRRSK